MTQTPNNLTPDEFFPTYYVTRAEWEADQAQRKAQRAEELAQQCRDREVLNEVRQDLKENRQDMREVLEYINQQKGREEQIEKTLEEFRVVNDWVDGVKNTALNTGKIAAWVIGIATAYKILLLPIIVKYFQKGGPTP